MERDPEIAELVKKGRFFSDADTEPILRVQFELLGKVLPKYREVQQSEQAELITSPYSHPMLPLLADLGIARAARPDLKMPRRPFKHLDDAAGQLRLGIDAHTRRFGRRPRGIWPPEAAISDDAERIAADQTIAWILIDVGVLSRSHPIPISP